MEVNWLKLTKIQASKGMSDFTRQGISITLISTQGNLKHIDSCIISFVRHYLVVKYPRDKNKRGSIADPREAAIKGCLFVSGHWDLKSLKLEWASSLNKGLQLGLILTLRVSAQFSYWAFTCLSGQRRKGNISQCQGRGFKSQSWLIQDCMLFRASNYNVIPLMTYLNYHKQMLEKQIFV